MNKVILPFASGGGGGGDWDLEWILEEDVEILNSNSWDKLVESELTLEANSLYNGIFYANMHNNGQSVGIRWELKPSSNIDIWGAGWVGSTASVTAFSRKYTNWAFALAQISSTSGATNTNSLATAYGIFSVKTTLANSIFYNFSQGTANGTHPAIMLAGAYIKLKKVV